MDVSAQGDQLDVVGIGSALVDILAPATDELLEELGLTKGSMDLVDTARSQAILSRIGSSNKMSGGSAANTMAGIAALGGRAGFIGKVADDELGREFTLAIGAVGVEFNPRPIADSAIGTGHCLVLVGADAERTMATNLGVASGLEQADLDPAFIERGTVLYLEGYLWDLPATKAVLLEAIELSHAAGASVAFSLSDSFCVERHRAEFLDLVRDHVDVLFGNADEMTALFRARSFEHTVESLGETGILAVMTNGAQGSVVVDPSESVTVPAAHVTSVVDTTGAGDLYAAGFLYGLTHGGTPAQCGELAGLCAAEIISHLGARPEVDISGYPALAGL